MEHLPAALAQLYNPSTRSGGWSDATQLKENVEALYAKAELATYISRGDVEAAIGGRQMYPARLDRFIDRPAPVWHFNVRPRFPMTWLANNVKDRPKGARKVEWLAYQDALDWARLRQVSQAVRPTAGSATASGSP